MVYIDARGVARKALVKGVSVFSQPSARDLTSYASITSSVKARLPRNSKAQMALKLWSSRRIRTIKMASMHRPRYLWEVRPTATSSSPQPINPLCTKVALHLVKRPWRRNDDWVLLYKVLMCIYKCLSESLVLEYTIN